MVQALLPLRDERLTAPIVLLENRDHDLRGLNGVVLDNGDQRTDHTVRRKYYLTLPHLRITRQHKRVMWFTRAHRLISTAHLRAPIRITPPPTDQIAPSGGSIRSFGQISNQAGSGRQSGIYINPAALAPDGSSHDPTTSGPNSLTSGPEDGSPPGTRVRRRRRFMRWFRDHLSRQAPWSPFSRHDPLRVRRAIREFDRMFHR